jgi:4-methyl-5(b-hydroxyethyl)-thiazole monophosphate biosynthesis
MIRSVLVVLAEGFEEIEAITPIDLLRRSGASVTVAGLNALSVTGSRKVVVNCDVLLQQCLSQPFDCVVLPGGAQGSVNLASSFELISKVIETAQNGLVAAICASPAVVLGKTGLLDNKRVTGYPGTEQKCPGLKLEDIPVIKDGNLITAQGPASAMEFSLAIIAALFDQETSDQIALQTLFQR